MSKIEKAVVAKVQFGIFEIEGLMLPDGSYGIALTQAWRLVDEKIARQKNELRQSKALLGKDFQPVKLPTDINPNKAYILTLLEFERLLAKADRAGYKGAQDLRDGLVGLSLHQLFCDAFGVKVEKEERTAFLKERLLHKKQFHPLYTYWLKEDGCENYGREVNRFKSKLSLPTKPIVEYDSEQMRLLNKGETEYNLLRKLGKTHREALDFLSE